MRDAIHVKSKAFYANTTFPGPYQPAANFKFWPAEGWNYNESRPHLLDVYPTFIEHYRTLIFNGNGPHTPTLALCVRCSACQSLASVLCVYTNARMIRKTATCPCLSPYTTRLFYTTMTYPCRRFRCLRALHPQRWVDKVAGKQRKVGNSTLVVCEHMHQHCSIINSTLVCNPSFFAAETHDFAFAPYNMVAHVRVRVDRAPRAVCSD